MIHDNSLKKAKLNETFSKYFEKHTLTIDVDFFILPFVPRCLHLIIPAITQKINHKYFKLFEL